jgi:hypothetical protein
MINTGNLLRRVPTESSNSNRPYAVPSARAIPSCDGVLGELAHIHVVDQARNDDSELSRFSMSRSQEYSIFRPVGAQARDTLVDMHLHINFPTGLISIEKAGGSRRRSRMESLLNKSRPQGQRQSID